MSETPEATDATRDQEEELEEDFRAIFAPGHIWTVQGPPQGQKMGTGKTTLAVQISQQGAEFGMLVYTNVMYKSPVRDKDGTVVDWYPEHGHERVQTPAMRARGGEIRKARSTAEVIYAIVEQGILDRRQSVLLVLDESMMIEGIRGGAGSGMQTREGASVAGFNTQLRKLGVCVLIIGLGDRFLAGMYRSGEEGSIITGSIRRVKIAGYDVKEVVEISTANTPRPIRVKTVPIRGLARPQSFLLEPGADDGPVFESFSPATFQTGTYKNGKPFSIDALLIAMSDVISERASKAVAEFLEREGGKREDSPAPKPKDETRLVLSDRADQIRQLIKTRHDLSDAAIGKLVNPPVTKQRVNGIRKEMREQGE